MPIEIDKDATENSHVWQTVSLQQKTLIPLKIVHK